MEILSILLYLLLSYLLGSLTFAGLFFREYREGIKSGDLGPKNLGALTVIWDKGWGRGVTVGIFDTFKAIVALSAGRYLLHLHDVILLAGGGAVILGHAFPLFFRFHGGRGISCFIATYLFLAPLNILIAMAAATLFIPFYRGNARVGPFIFVTLAPFVSLALKDTTPPFINLFLFSLFMALINIAVSLWRRSKYGRAYAERGV